MSVFISPPGRRGHDPFSKLLLTGDSLTDTSTPRALGHPYARYALSFDGTSQYAQTASTSDLTLADGDFTIRGWFRFTSVSAYFTYLLDKTSSSKEWSIYYQNDYGLIFWWSINGTTNAGSKGFPGLLSANTWYFIQIVRGSGYISCYVNGVQAGTTQVFPDTIYEGVSSLNLGQGGTVYFPGHVADIEVAKGVARTNAVPSSPIAPDSHTSALLQIDDSGQVRDGSGTGKTWTLYGSPQTVTAHPVTNSGVTIAEAVGYYQNLAAACYFDGGSSLSVADDSSLEFGTQDFTIELLVSHSTAISNGMCYVSKGANSALSWIFGMYSSSYIGFWWSTNGTTWSGYDGCSWTPTIGKTYRVVLVRSGCSVYIYVDGVRLSHIITIPATILDTAAPLRIGDYYSHPSLYGLTGCISDLRVSVGTNRGYTGDTIPVPTSPLETDAYTQLLLPLRKKDSAFTDVSGTGKTLTTSGTPVMVNTPLGSKALTFGGSAYLSCLTNSDFRLKSEDFTIDTFMKFGTISTQQSIISVWGTSNQSWWVVWYPNSLGFWYSTTGADSPNFSVAWAPVLNRWYHLAVCRVGTIVRFFIDGTQVGSDQTLAATLFDSTASLVVGGYASAGAQFTGQIANLRVTKGLARWTRDFTPPVRAY